ncbi:MAG: CopD family protein [Flavobacteriales bacterium]
MDILYIKALHVIFVISWFAGLLYIVRLFIYHAEAEVKPDPIRQALRNQFKVMQYRLWNIITWPAAILATVFGIWLVEKFNYWSQPWMMVKFALVILLWVYHIITHLIYRRMQQDRVRWNSTQLRVWNEVATLWMVSIVFVVILKGTMNWLYATFGFFAIGILLMLGIRIYKRLRKS